MKFCSNCGKELLDEAVICVGCNTPVDDEYGKAFFNSSNSFSPSTPPTPPLYQTDTTPSRHSVPQCTCCGHIGEWKAGPFLKWYDWIFVIWLMIPTVIPGIIYLVIIALIRGKKNNREKICRKCGAHNMFTFIY